MWCPRTLTPSSFARPRRHKCRRGPRRGALRPAAPGEAELPGTQEGQLASYAEEAGLHDIASSALTISLRFESYDEWWAPYLLGVGPLGAYVATLEADHLLALKERCLELLPTAPFEQPAVAWNVRALAVTA